MLNISKTVEDKTLIIKLEGRLDTLTSPELDAELRSSCDGIQELILDCADLKYISSAGLRVLLASDEDMNARGGRMVLRNVGRVILKILKVTGLTDVLCIE